MYLLNMWDNGYDYQWTLIYVSHYYEMFPYEAKKKINSIQSKENTSQ
jgi:hypothetical protein